MCLHTRTQTVLMAFGGVRQLRALCIDCGDSRPATKAEWHAWKEQIEALNAPHVVRHQAREYTRRSGGTRRLDYATYRERLRSRPKQEGEHA